MKYINWEEDGSPLRKGALVDVLWTRLEKLSLIYWWYLLLVLVLLRPFVQW